MNISAEIDIDNRPTIKDILKKVEEVKEEAAKDPGASLKSLSLQKRNTEVIQDRTPLLKPKVKIANLSEDSELVLEEDED